MRIGYFEASMIFSSYGVELMRMVIIPSPVLEYIEYLASLLDISAHLGHEILQKGQYLTDHLEI